MVVDSRSLKPETQKQSYLYLITPCTSTLLLPQINFFVEFRKQLTTKSSGTRRFAGFAGFARFARFTRLTSFARFRASLV